MKLATKLKISAFTGLIGAISLGGLAIHSIENSEIISHKNEKYLVLRGPQIFDELNYIAIRKIQPQSPFRYYDFNNDGILDRKEYTSCSKYFCSLKSEEINKFEQKEFEKLHKILNKK